MQMISTEELQQTDVGRKGREQGWGIQILLLHSSGKPEVRNTKKNPMA